MTTSLSDEEMIHHYLPEKPDLCFKIIYNRYVKKVYNRCLFITKNRDLAQDFTHDIFLKAFDKLAYYQGKSRFSTWLYSIVFNYCADQLRIAKRLATVELSIEIEQSVYESADSYIQEETFQRIQQAIDRLSVQERTFLRLKYEDELSIEEIGQRYGLQPSAVKMRLKRSREKVQALYSTL
ncbi:RNA polymerase sigma factor [Spirosoma harenae]